MNISELHKALHPKLGSYSGSLDEYSDRIGTDMAFAIQKSSAETWSMTVYERGQQVSQATFATESDACAAAFAFVKEA